ncbi:MAG: nucleic acid-binding protein, partial [Candidatus Poribacteria bacterium]|nr:nucleic acid-binding protein [Candidatus Poribacteria bacterium]
MTRRLHTVRGESTAAQDAVRRFRSGFENALYTTIVVNSQRINDAMCLAEAHGLRGYDAVQLAAALVLRQPNEADGGEGQLLFVSADDGLNEVA